VDVHDVPNLKHFTKEAVEGLKLLVKSNYHRSCFPDLPDDKFGVIPNGIDSAQFTPVKKVKNSLIWTSSYDRGLYFLLKMWPQVKKAVPDATLDIYYGFALFDVTPWGKQKSGQEWKRQMIQLMAQDGITEHGRVGTDEIAQAYLRADIFAYPTDFPEISCISTMKAQAAKCRVLTTNFAALAETVIGKEDKLDIHDEKDFATYQNKLIELLKTPRDEKELDDIAAEAVKRYDWDNIAKKWDEEFNASS
jgi:glycosyltransferase involved in cell wall biosynthesis